MKKDETKSTYGNQDPKKLNQICMDIGHGYYVWHLNYKKCRKDFKKRPHKSINWKKTLKWELLHAYIIDYVLYTIMADYMFSLKCTEGK